VRGGYSGLAAGWKILSLQAWPDMRPEPEVIPLGTLVQFWAISWPTLAVAGRSNAANR